MKLLTKDLIKKFPPLNTTDSKDTKDINIIAKFFTPDSSWTWYATEFDGKNTFFGYVRGIENELGYFYLTELNSVKGHLGLHIERDMHFGSHTLKEVMDKRI